MMTDMDEDPWRCKYCGETFHDDFESMEEHIYTHHGGPSLTVGPPRQGEMVPILVTDRELTADEIRTLHRKLWLRNVEGQRWPDKARPPTVAEWQRKYGQR